MARRHKTRALLALMQFGERMRESWVRVSRATRVFNRTEYIVRIRYRVGGSDYIAGYPSARLAIQEGRRLARVRMERCVVDHDVR